MANTGQWLVEAIIGATTTYDQQSLCFRGASTTFGAWVFCLERMISMTYSVWFYQTENQDYDDSILLQEVCEDELDKLWKLAKNILFDRGIVMKITPEFEQD